MSVVVCMVPPIRAVQSRAGMGCELRVDAVKAWSRIGAVVGFVG
ncbi:hypothetical protein [Corynebacterium felinum]|nr:hypothetical protein [Corynebacterium felinum]